MCRPRTSRDGCGPRGGSSVSGHMAYARVEATIVWLWSVEIISLHIEKIWWEWGMFAVAREDSEDDGEAIRPIFFAEARYCPLAWLDSAGLGMLLYTN